MNNNLSLGLPQFLFTSTFFFVILQSIKEKKSDVETDMSYILQFLGFCKEKK